MLSRIKLGGEMPGATTAKAWLPRDADMLSRRSSCSLCPEQIPRKQGAQRSGSYPDNSARREEGMSLTIGKLGNVLLHIYDFPFEAAIYLPEVVRYEADTSCIVGGGLNEEASFH